MPDITVAATFQAQLNDVSITADATQDVDMTGDPMLSNVQTVGTSTEAINFNDVSSASYVYMKNLDDTNFVDVGLDTPVTQIFARLFPGQFMIFPVKTMTMYAKADTAPVSLHVVTAQV